MSKYERVAFDATDGTTLRGRFYRPAMAGPTAIVIIAGGFSSVVEQVLYSFAEQFAEAGLATLAFDYRNFGESDGAIRQEIDPYMQLSDLRDAITFAQALPGIDAQRIGVWGSSFGGGHALFLGAVDRRIKCIVAQVPFISGSQITRNLPTDLLSKTHAAFAADRSARLRGEPPQMIRVVSADPAVPAVLAGRDAYQWMERNLTPMWRNEVTLRSMDLAGAYEPGSYVSRIAPTPLLMIVGAHDELIASDLALEAFGNANESKKLMLLEAGHFDPYDVKFEECCSAATAWFQEHLC